MLHWQLGENPLPLPRLRVLCGRNGFNTVVAIGPLESLRNHSIAEA